MESARVRKFRKWRGSEQQLSSFKEIYCAAAAENSVLPQATQNMNDRPRSQQILWPQLQSDKLFHLCVCVCVCAERNIVPRWCRCVEVDTSARLRSSAQLNINTVRLKPLCWLQDCCQGYIWKKKKNQNTVLVRWCSGSLVLKLLVWTHTHKMAGSIKRWKDALRINTPAPNEHKK